MFFEEKADSDDEDKYADDVSMPGQKFETKQRITVRNLRIREDTAKVSFFYSKNYLKVNKELQFRKNVPQKHVFL